MAEPEVTKGGYSVSHKVMLIYVGEEPGGRGGAQGVSVAFVGELGRMLLDHAVWCFCIPAGVADQGRGGAISV